MAGRDKRRKRDSRGKIPNRKSIEERPAAVEQRQRIGDWEADLISGARHKGYVVTLVDRKSRLSVLGHVQRKQADSVSAEIARILQPYRKQVHTITFDNGHECAAHEFIAQARECQCYVAQPYRSCQRATNENTNGLIRQYFQKKMDLRWITHEQLDHVQTRLNHRPRKTHGFVSPIEVFRKN